MKTFALLAALCCPIFLPGKAPAQCTACGGNCACISCACPVAPAYPIRVVYRTACPGRLCQDMLAPAAYPVATPTPVYTAFPAGGCPGGVCGPIVGSSPVYGVPTGFVGGYAGGCSACGVGGCSGGGCASCGTAPRGFFGRRR